MFLPLHRSGSKHDARDPQPDYSAPARCPVRSLLSAAITRNMRSHHATTPSIRDAIAFFAGGLPNSIGRTKLCVCDGMQPFRSWDNVLPGWSKLAYLMESPQDRYWGAPGASHVLPAPRGNKGTWLPHVRVLVDHSATQRRKSYLSRRCQPQIQSLRRSQIR